MGRGAAQTLGAVVARDDAVALRLEGAADEPERVRVAVDVKIVAVTVIP